MIRINLLEVREERRKMAFRNLAVISVTVWICTAVFLFVWHGTLTDQIDYTQSEIKKVEIEISQLEQIVNEINQIKAKKKDLEEKLEIIRGLEANRAEIVDLLLAVSEVLTEDAWIESLNVNRRRISASAFAIDMQSIGQLIRRLKVDSRFDNPRTSKIQTATKRGTSGSGYVSFELSVDFVPPQATDVAGKSKKGQ